MGKKLIAISLMIFAMSTLLLVPSVLLTGNNAIIDDTSKNYSGTVESSGDLHSSMTDDSTITSSVDSVGQDSDVSKADSSDTDSSSLDSSSTDSSNTDVSKPDDSNPQDNPVVPTPEGSIVQTHGMLKVSGNSIVDKNGKPYQMRGMSTHGLTWFPKFVNFSSFKTFRDDWGANTIRLAMYVDEWGNSECYMNNPDGSKKLMTQGIEACLDLGMYVIVDWHMLNPGDPTKYTTEAKAFFKEFATKYKSYDNIIYEICNEPNGGDVRWSNKIKPYADELVKVIRNAGAKNIIIVGTGTWSQDIHDVLNNRINDSNTVYAFHFYADTHTEDFRTRVKQCYQQGLPILVSEFGIGDASGDGRNNLVESSKWLALLDSLNIGYFNWNISDKDEDSACFVPNTSGSGNWTTSSLTESGKFIRSWLRKKAGL